MIVEKFSLEASIVDVVYLWSNGKKVAKKGLWSDHVILKIINKSDY